MRFGFVTGDGVRWLQRRPCGSLAWKQRDGQDERRRVQRAAPRLGGDGADRRPPAAGDAAVRRLLGELKVQGSLDRAGGDAGQGPLDAPTKYQAKALFSGLALAQAAAQAESVGRPGLRNATLQVTASEAGGQARLDIADGR